jgi:hypothetical protein
MRIFILILLLTLRPLLLKAISTEEDSLCIVCKTSSDNNARGDLFSLECWQNHHAHSACIRELPKQRNDNALSTKSQCAFCIPQSLEMMPAKNPLRRSDHSAEAPAEQNLLRWVQQSTEQLLGFIICGHQSLQAESMPKEKRD